MRALILLFALTAATAHAQTRAVIVVNTSDGFVLRDVSDAPIEDESAILLTASDDGSAAWTMQTLQSGENPSTVLARGVERRAHHRMALDLQRDGANRHRTVSAYHRARRARQEDMRVDGNVLEVVEEMELLGDGEIIDTSVERRAGGSRSTLRSIEVADGGARSVRFEVSAQIDRALNVRDPLVAAFTDNDALVALEVGALGGRTDLEVTFAFDTVGEWEAWMEAHTEMLNAIRDRSDDDSLGLKLDIR